ncbi:MAG: TlpA family protein disulfide reductase [Armatimonadetes bacterium]|nr:TlpA family protein disulfide reductase [Armatimonadota bacterium]
MKPLPGWLSGSLIVLVAIGAVWFLAASTTPSEERGVGKPAPPLAGTATTGKPFALSDYRGKVVLINFWGEWCPPCVQEIPDLVSLQKKYERRGFTIIGLAENKDPNLTEAQYRAFLTGYLAKNGMTYPNVPAPEGAKQAYGLEVFPTSYLLDKRGNIVYATVGAIDPADIASRIEKQLSKGD